MNHSKSQIAKNNRILLVAAVLLLGLSAFTYQDSVRRADRFERGQKLLPHLDPDEIAEISLREGSDEASEVLLRRSASGDRFVVHSEGGYRADNAEVNRLLRQLMDLELEKEVGEATEDLGAELGLFEENGELPDGTVEVTLRNAAEKEMVRILAGKEFDGEGASGRYLRRVGSRDGGEEGESETTAGMIYLSQGRVDLRVAGGDYVDKEIVDVPRDDVQAIRGDGFVLARDGEGGDLKLQDIPEGKKESSKATGMKGALSPLRFSKHHLADAPEVRGLVFTRGLRVELNDGSGYVLEVARSGAGDDTKAYLRVSGFSTTEQVYVDTEDSEDVVREKSNLLVRADEIAAFSEYHGSWIYEITDIVADRIDVGAVDLVQDS